MIGKMIWKKMKICFWDINICLRDRGVWKSNYRHLFIIFQSANIVQKNLSIHSWHFIITNNQIKLINFYFVHCINSIKSFFNIKAVALKDCMLDKSCCFWIIYNQSMINMLTCRSFKFLYIITAHWTELFDDHWQVENWNHVVLFIKGKSLQNREILKAARHWHFDYRNKFLHFINNNTNLLRLKVYKKNCIHYRRLCYWSSR